MRIGVDATCWANKRGYGRYAREILSALAKRPGTDEIVCFLDEDSYAAFDLSADNVSTVVVPQGRATVRAAVSGSNRSLSDMLRFSRAVARESPDVFFAPTVYSYFPLPLRQRVVVAIHDAIAERFPELTLPSRRDRLFWRMKVALALHQATLVLTVSDYARSEIIRELRVGGDKVRVAIEAPSRGYTPQMDPGTIASAAEAVGIPRGSSWFLYVGGFNPHKRVPDIVRAHAALVREGHSEAPFLVLVGEPDDGFFSESERIRDAIRAEGTTDRVIWAGFVSDECLRSLHSGSLGLLLVSHSEGFGLPAVEAAACGCPVVATTESPLPELLEGGGHFVEPGDVEGVLAAMRRLITEPSWRRRLGQTALARSRALSWDRAALALHDALHEAAR